MVSPLAHLPPRDRRVYALSDSPGPDANLPPVDQRLHWRDSPRPPSEADIKPRVSIPREPTRPRVWTVSRIGGIGP